MQRPKKSSCWNWKRISKVHLDQFHKRRMISITELEMELKFRRLLRIIFHKPRMNSITELMQKICTLENFLRIKLSN